MENLRVHFAVQSGGLRQREMGVIRAVDGVSFTLRQGETLALVGAARCGKTTLARVAALLEQPTGGRIHFQGRELTTWRGRHLKRARRDIQMVFSNPYGAFPPRLTVEEILKEATRPREARFGRQRDQRLVEVMRQVGLNLYLSVRFPRELSGATRQRLAVARALGARPNLLICDQPTLHLDPSAGEALIDLLQGLHQDLGLTMLLTTRRLELARHAERVAVMVLGRIVEMGYYRDLVRQPLHPFTQALLALPFAGYIDQVGFSLDPARAARGCRYAPVCPRAEERCRASYPALVEGAPDHGVACHLVEAPGA